MNANDARAVMQVLARTIDDFLNGKADPKRVGFALLVFPLNGPEGQRTNYVSNGRRNDMLAALKEVIARFEGRHQEGGNA